jgi:hypothetical protein
MKRTVRSVARFSDFRTQCRVRTDIAWDMMDWPVNKTVSVHRDHCLAVRLEQIGVLLYDAVFGRLCLGVL